MSIISIVLLVIILAAIFTMKKDTEPSAVENSDKSISKKLDILLFLRGLLYFSIFLVTAIFIDSFIDLMEVLDKLNKFFFDDDILYGFLKDSVIRFVVHLIVLFSLTKIIEFLFDSNRNTEK